MHIFSSSRTSIVTCAHARYSLLRTYILPDKSELEGNGQLARLRFLFCVNFPQFTSLSYRELLGTNGESVDEVRVRVKARPQNKVDYDNILQVCRFVSLA